MRTLQLRTRVPTLPPLRRTIALLGLPLLQLSSPAQLVPASCEPDWIATFGDKPGVGTGLVHAIATFDDGGGLALYVGGSFITAGGTQAQRIGRFDGANWATLGSGTNDEVYALAVFDDGGGPALYAGGAFTTAGGGNANHIAKWNGTAWSPLGSGVDDDVRALVVFDDGGGPALFVGGDFATAGGAPAPFFAKWDGSNWTAPSATVDGLTRAFAVFDDGSGAALFVGGQFANAGGNPASNVAKWNGTTWSALAAGVSAQVEALTVFDDGSGVALFVGGRFAQAGGAPASRIAKWDGASWSACGSGTAQGGGTSPRVKALLAYDDGSGPALYVGGEFGSAGGLPNTFAVARWDGSSWSALDQGLVGVVRALVAFDAGGGSKLYAAGGFGPIPGTGAVANSIASWDGSSFGALTSGLNQQVSVLETLDDGTGPALYAGGDFVAADGLQLNGIGKWNGSSWTALGGGVVRANALRVFDDGSGPAVYAGSFQTVGIRKWNGVSWTSIGTPNGGVNAFEVFDDGSGPALFAGGTFEAFVGGPLADGLAKWNGTSWTSIGGGMSGSIDVYALRVFDDGNGPALYIGGSFLNIGGIAAKHIVKWDGTTWTALGAGSQSLVQVLGVFDDGSGPALYASGSFTSAGGAPISHIAKWDGMSWQPLGSGTNSSVYSLTVFDDGTGPALIAGGAFTVAGGLPVSRVARWDGANWSALGPPGVSSNVLALAAFDDQSGAGAALYVGGQFIASPTADSYLARWGCNLTSSGGAYCTSGTTTGGCVPAISGVGSASASAGAGFTISTANVDGQRPGLLFYGLSGAHSAPWGMGSTSFLCVKSPTQRMSLSSSGGTNGACDGTLAEDWNAYIATHPGALGQTFSGGEIVRAQAWFRDPGSAKTTALSNGLVFTVDP